MPPTWLTQPAHSALSCSVRLDPFSRSAGIFFRSFVLIKVISPTSGQILTKIISVSCTLSLFSDTEQNGVKYYFHVTSFSREILFVTFKLQLTKSYGIAISFKLRCIKLRFCEKATKFREITSLDLTFTRYTQI